MSVQRLILRQDSMRWSILTLFYCGRKVFHQFRSALMLAFKWYILWYLLNALNKRQRNTLPGTTTLAANDRNPCRERSSLRWILFPGSVCWTHVFALSNLLSGKRASIASESISMPKNSTSVPQMFFSVLIFKPSNAHNTVKYSSYWSTNKMESSTAKNYLNSVGLSIAHWSIPDWLF